jgi:5'-nucleotidase
VLHIVITNDDGYAAPGIAVVAAALAELPDTEVSVVAPKENQSGAGGKTTPGTLAVTDVKTADGRAAHAVAGTPADTIRAALDDLHLTPELVVSGSNQGQNLGPAADLSGTVGAARAAVARGIPAVAVSAGLGDKPPYAQSAKYVTDWVQANRAALLDKSATAQVVSFNVPDCASIRGLAQVEPDLNPADLGKMTHAPKCTSAAAAGKDDVTAFLRGFATQSLLPAKPAA